VELILKIKKSKLIEKYFDLFESNFIKFILKSNKL